MSPTPQPQTAQPLKAPRHAMVEIIRFLHQRGWTPATSSNFSCRTGVAGNEEVPGFAISVSGLDKETFTLDDFIEVDGAGQPSNPAQVHLKPSAETLLHAMVYRLFPKAQTVLHTHSIDGTVLSKLYEAQGGLALKDFEILKGLEGVKTHETELWLPIFPNSQDMNTLAKQIESALLNRPPVYGFMLAGHGLYTWGETPAQAKRHVEVFEYLFEAILKLRLHGYADYSG